MNNEEVLKKTLETSDLANGGQLYPEQMDRFFQLVHDSSVMVKAARFDRVSQKQKDIDRMHIGEPITESAEENTQNTGTGKPVFDKIPINCKKVRSGWNITTETLQENIEKDQLEDTIMSGMSKRIGSDVELLAIQGDDSIVVDGSKIQALLVRLDGWDVQTAQAHIVDVAGDNVSKTVFAEMIRSMPQQYLQDPDLQFFMSKMISIDWQDTLADRLTGAGDDALMGRRSAPYGYPILDVPFIPSDKDLTVTEATSGYIMGTKFGPFTITAGSNDLLKIQVGTGGTAREVTLTAGVYQTSEMAYAINNAHADFTVNGIGIAGDNGYGQLLLLDPTLGPTSEIQVVVTSTAGENAREDLGFYGTLPLSGTGSASTTTGTVTEGSFIWFANPKNFIVAMVNNPRFYSEFNQDYDRIEVRGYNQLDVKIENLDAIVKATNVRRKSY